MHFHDNMIQMKSFNWNILTNKTSLTNYYERQLVLKNLPKYSLAIGISKNSLEYINTALPKKIKRVLLLNAIDLSRFQKIAERAKYNQLIMIGSLNDLKGQVLAIHTVAELQTRNINVSLTLVGDGPNAEKLKELAQKLKIESLVKFTGFIDHPEKMLQDSSIYIHTSYSEAFGLVLIEAMACGLPVVCTDGKGNRDLIKEGVNGFMIWERDPKLLADKIQFLLENEQEYARICNNAYKFAQNFGIEAYVDFLLNTYI
jgi:glycosyltransferase involved in cell wall biosynthesis